MDKEQIGVCNKAFDVLVKDKSILRAENKPIFEGLEKAIGETITERIKKLDLSKKRCVLLTGKDDDLIRGIACYIYYHYKREHEAFYYMDYLLEREFIKREGFKYRWTSKVSKRDYTCEVLKDGVLFVENLMTDDTELLNTLAAKTRNIMAGCKAGMLIVSTKDAGAFSAYFLSQFEDIRLEPTTQDTPTKDITLLYDVNARILFLDCKRKYRLTRKGQKLFDYLKKDGYRDVFDICEHMEYTTNRKNFDSFLSKLNEKTKTCLGFNVIGNLETGGGKYAILPKVKDGNFKKQDSGKMKAR